MGEISLSTAPDTIYASSTDTIAYWGFVGWDYSPPIDGTYHYFTVSDFFNPDDPCANVAQRSFATQVWEYYGDEAGYFSFPALPAGTSSLAWCVGTEDSNVAGTEQGILYFPVLEATSTPPLSTSTFSYRCVLATSSYLAELSTSSQIEFVCYAKPMQEQFFDYAFWCLRALTVLAVAAWFYRQITGKKP